MSSRSLARTLIRCSCLPTRNLSTIRSVLQNRHFQKSSLNQQPARLAPSLQIVRPMSSATKFEVINVQDELDFKKRVLEKSSSIPVVVDFHATWCGPCKILGPRLESLMSKEEGKVLMAKVDIDDHPDLAMEFGVRSVPTVVGMKNGKVLNQFVGVIDDDQIGSFLDKLIVS